MSKNGALLYSAWVTCWLLPIHVMASHGHVIKKRAVNISLLDQTMLLI